MWEAEWLDGAYSAYAEGSWTSTKPHNLFVIHCFSLLLPQEGQVEAPILLVEQMPRFIGGCTYHFWSSLK
jgi:hypothetical protein